MIKKAKVEKDAVIKKAEKLKPYSLQLSGEQADNRFQNSTHF